jgi:hypothetical protein
MSLQLEGTYGNNMANANNKNEVKTIPIILNELE